MSIQFHSADARVPLKHRTAIKEWLGDVALKERKRIGQLDYIFCSDDYLLNINRQFLQHHTYTDIITFDYSENGLLSGEIYISLDRVKENAAQYHVTFMEELCRVMVHGLLHLAGYKDKKPQEQQLMRHAEDAALVLLFEE
jgi:rRNA maturation RNase YbeY